MFSAFYLPLLAILLCLILRAVSFEWRLRGDGKRWRTTWLVAGVVASFAAPLLWGVALAGLLSGIPLDSKGHPTGDIGNLFSAYTLFAGVAVVALFAFHGATFLTLRTSGELCARAVATARRLAIPATVLVVASLAWTVAVAVDHNQRGALGPAVPAVLGAVALLLAALSGRRGRSGRAFAMTAVATVAWIATVFTGLYPRVLVSDPTFANSLTVSNAAAAHYALEVVTVVAAIFTPLVLLYQGWTYRVFRHRVGGEASGEPVVTR
jgi:cytochrome d ubiquinol oxidase subunit II